MNIISWLIVGLSFTASLSCSADYDPKIGYGVISTEVVTKSDENHIQSPRDSAKDQRMNDFILDGLMPYHIEGYKADTMIAYLEARFGKSISKLTTNEPDREPDYINENTTLKFNGVTIVISTPLYKGKKTKNLTTWISYIGITTNGYKLKHGLKIGSSKREFIDILGRGRNSSNNLSLDYTTWGTYTGSVKIEFDKSLKATRIIWEYYAEIE